jgi:hypothetical protein
VKRGTGVANLLREQTIMATTKTADEIEREKNRYRFSGYHLPLIQLDGTGPGYVQMPAHRYFRYPQQEAWSREAFTTFRH